VTTDTDSFPSITFPATFEGAAGLGADFSATLKFKTSDGPTVLRDLHALPRGTYDLTIVSRQAALAGDSTDREWANMELQQVGSEGGEIAYEPLCIGSRCPVFACHSSGEFEGKYVCEDGAETEVYMEVLYGETRCPRYGAAEDEAGDAEAAADAAVGETEHPALTGGPLNEMVAKGEPTGKGAVVLVVYPSDAGDADPHATPVGEFTRPSELVADYLAEAHVEEPVAFYEVSWSEDAGSVLLPMDEPIPGEYYGQTLYVDRRDDIVNCPTCDGDGRQPDKSGGGHHGTCKTCGGLGMALPAGDEA
jgi:hypothetical protein